MKSFTIPFIAPSVEVSAVVEAVVGEVFDTDDIDDCILKLVVEYVSTLVLEIFGDVIDGVMLSVEGVVKCESDTVTEVSGNVWLEEKDVVECALEVVLEKLRLETTGNIAFVDNVVGV